MLIEVRIALSLTITETISRAGTAIRKAKLGMRSPLENICVFGPRRRRKCGTAMGRKEIQPTRRKACYGHNERPLPLCANSLDLDITRRTCSG